MPKRLWPGSPSRAQAPSGSHGRRVFASVVPVALAAVVAAAVPAQTAHPTAQKPVHKSAHKPAHKETPRVEVAPGTLVRWAAPGTKRCATAGRSWKAMDDACYYPIDLL